MVHFSFYVPLDHAEKVKAACFAAGGGRIGNYENCSFEFEGIGQFRPLKESNPFVGEARKVEKVKELKVEMVCEEHLIQEILTAMKKAHPYETPAYYMIKTLSF